MDVKKFTDLSWEDLRYFACFAASGSLSAAARELDVEHATVARRIASLEASLKLKLVDRRGRKLRMTAAGEQIAAIIGRMGAEAQKVQRHARHAASDVTGEVSISAPPAFAAAMLARPLTVLHRRHPDLRILVSSDTHVVSLDRREADLAIRLRRPERGDLTAVKLGQIPFRLFASTEYLERTAEADWEYVALGGVLSDSPQQTVLDGAPGARGLSVDQIEMQIALVRAGAGVAVLPDFLAAPDPLLARARPQLQAPALIRDVWLTYHSDMKSAAPVQAVIRELKTLRF